MASVFENTTNSKQNYTTIQLKYQEKNKEAIGAKVFLYANGTKQSKQLFKSRGFLSSTEAKVNFGLGSISKIDSIVIVWPNLMHQKIENLQANQLLKIDYNSELAVLKS